jgi:hypothetical protein
MPRRNPLDAALWRTVCQKGTTVALLAGSPAVGAIPLADCHIHYDQREFPRPDNGEGACDIGAYEF